MKGKHIAGTIRPYQMEWIDKMVKQGEFHNKSHALVYSLLIAKRVYEHGTDEEKAKFLFGRGIK